MSYEIADLGTKVKITSNNPKDKHKVLAFPKNSTTYLRLSGTSGGEDYFRLTCYGSPSMDIKASEVSSPTVADADALEVVLLEYFFSESGASTVSVTYAGLQDLISDSLLVTGRHYHVTDLCDRGAVVMATSANSISESAHGLYLDCVWQYDQTGDSSDVETLTGIPVAGFLGQWEETPSDFFQIGPVTMTLAYTGLSGTFAMGDAITVGSWGGEVLTDNGSSMKVIPTNPAGPVNPGDTITGPSGSATIALVVLLSVGDTITDGAGWSAEILSLETGSMTVRATAGTTPLVGDVIGNASSDTEILDAISYEGAISTYLDTTDVASGYRMYQLTDKSALTADPPSVNTDAWTVLPRNASNYGYRLSSCRILLDVTNAWVYQREDKNAFVRTTFMDYDNDGIFSILSYPWGNPYLQSMHIEGSWEVYNTKASLYRWTLEAGSTVQAEMLSGVVISDVRVLESQEWTGYTVVGSFQNMTVAVPSTNLFANPIVNRTHDIFGNLIAYVTVTHDMLINDILSGVEIVSSFQQKFTKATVILEYVFGGLAAYTEGQRLHINTGAVKVGETPTNMLNGMRNQTVTLTLDFNQLSIGENQGLSIHAPANFTNGDATNVLNVTVIWY